MTTIGTDSVPRLRRGVRLTYDKVRETHVLLFPEGVLVPNPTAAAVLKLCDGTATVAAVTSALRTQYSGVQDQEILNVLARLEERRVVEWK